MLFFFHLIAVIKINLEILGVCGCGRIPVAFSCCLGEKFLIFQLKQLWQNNVAPCRAKVMIVSTMEELAAPGHSMAVQNGLCLMEKGEF